MARQERRNQKIAALALFGFALLYLVASLRLKTGTPANPGPGLIPVVLGALLVLCTTVHLIGVWRPDARGPEAEPAGAGSGARRDHRAVLGILAATALYPLLLDTLKFLVSTCGVAFVMLVLLKPGRLLSSLVLALGLTLAAFLTFSRLLEVPLPSGPLETWLLRVGR